MARHKARGKKDNHHHARMSIGHCPPCGGKETHATRRGAERTIRTMRLNGRTPDEDCRLDAYACPEGGGFHIGNRPLGVNGPNLNDPRIHFLGES